MGVPFFSYRRSKNFNQSRGKISTEEEEMLDEPIDYFLALCIVGALFWAADALDRYEAKKRAGKKEEEEEDDDYDFTS